MSAEFIQLISDLHFQRFTVHLANFVQSKVPIGVFFGFNANAENIIACTFNLKNIKINLSCICVIAKTPTLIKKLKNLDVPVISLEDFEKFGDTHFKIAKPAAIIIPDVVKDLAFVPYFNRYKIECLSPLGMDNQERYFLFMMKNLPNLYQVYNFFTDDESKKTYRAAIKGRLTGNMADYHFAPEAQYFLDGFIPQAGDIAIDGGSFDGGTSAAFAKCGAEVYAFEMDAKNYQTCLERAEKFGFTIENLGLSDKESEALYSHNDYNPAGSRRNLYGGGIVGKFIDLDSYSKKKNLPRVDYIKLDIEGAELDMLHGAKETIQRCKPKMAISAYHKPEDMWTLANYIKSLRPDYEFKFRHYGVDFTDYTMNDLEREVLDYFKLSYLAPNNGEYVLYCR